MILKNWLSYIDSFFFYRKKCSFLLWYILQYIASFFFFIHMINLFYVKIGGNIFEVKNRAFSVNGYTLQRSIFPGGKFLQENSGTQNIHEILYTSIYCICIYWPLLLHSQRFGFLKLYDLELGNHLWIYIWPPLFSPRR